MGQVYLSFTPGGRALAVKVVRPEFAEDQEFRRRFAHEIGSAQRVQGLYTAPVIDSDADAAVPWLATAYVPGPSLQQVVADQGPLPGPVVLDLIAGVAQALTAIHAAGLIHRDLKPANVLLAADGPKVIDFGIAHAADSTSLTRTGARIGTPGYMAPEQVLGHSLTPAADVFALGHLAVFAATGHSAFGEGQVDALLFRITTQPPNLDGCPPSIADVAAQCLAKDPAQRPTLAQIIEAVGPASPQHDGSWLPTQVAALLTGYDPGPAPPHPDRLSHPAATPPPAPAVGEPWHPSTLVQPAWAVPQPAPTTPPQRSLRPGSLAVFIAATTIVVLAAIVALIIAGSRTTTIGTTAATGTTPVSQNAAPQPAPPPTSTATVTAQAPPRATVTAPAPPAATVTTTAVTPPPPPATDDPAGVVQAYYDAINRHDYQTAWDLGGRNFGQSYATFRDGYATTAGDDVTVTAVNGHTVTVSLTATHTDGSVRQYTGSYTVYNGVITSGSITPN